MKALTIPACAATTLSIVSCATATGAEFQDLKVGPDDNGFLIYGQFNKSFLSYDDSEIRRLYPLIDNNNSGTRLGIWAHDTSNAVWSFGVNVEVGGAMYSTSDVNQLTEGIDIGNVNLRKGEFYLEHDALGRIWVGHGSMASDGTSEVDLSGTYLAAYASVSDIADAQLFRLSSGALSGIEVGDAFSDLDGLGRKTRMRFDTPRYNNLWLSTSIDINRDWDVALKYQGDIGDFSMAAESAYSHFFDDSSKLVNGSISALHNPTGLSLTVAAGRQTLSTSDPAFIYGKLGYQVQWFEYGRSFISVDAYSGHNFETQGSESRSYGIAVTQNVDAWNTTYYMAVRNYRFETDGESYLAGMAAIIGARLRF